MLRLHVFTFIFICSNFKFIQSNIWDNLFSQLKSPQFTLPDETMVELFNFDKKMMDVLISSSRNLIKISLVDKDMAYLLANSSNVVDIYVNFTNATVNFDFTDNCTYKNISLLNKFTTKFFLASYDFLTFFEEKENLYQYTFTNPLARRNNTQLQNFKTSFNLETKRNFRNLQLEYLDEAPTKKFPSKETISKLGALFKFNDQDETTFIFKVNKTTLNLKSINGNYNGIKFELKSKSTVVDKFDDSLFQLKHACEYFGEYQ